MKAMKVLLLLAISSAFACSAEATSGETASEELGADEAAVGGSPDGIYEVPVTDASLVPYATYEVTDVKFQRRADGTYRLHYDLPTQLVGNEQKVDLRGDVRGSTFTLTGAIGTAECTQTGSDVVCNEKFPGMVVDLPGVETALAADGVVGTAATARLAVSARFGIDPIGILRFKRGGSGGRGGRD